MRILESGNARGSNPSVALVVAALNSIVSRLMSIQQIEEWWNYALSKALQHNAFVSAPTKAEGAGKSEQACINKKKVITSIIIIQSFQVVYNLVHHCRIHQLQWREIIGIIRRCLSRRLSRRVE